MAFQGVFFFGFCPRRQKREKEKGKEKRSLNA
jgi:hypothetical protein